MLYSLLAKAFDLKCDFSISYKTADPNGQEVHLAVLSDWDLDAAFLRYAQAFNLKFFFFILSFSLEITYIDYLFIVFSELTIIPYRPEQIHA